VFHFCCFLQNEQDSGDELQAYSRANIRRDVKILWSDSHFVDDKTETRGERPRDRNECMADANWSPGILTTGPGLANWVGKWSGGGVPVCPNIYSSLLCPWYTHPVPATIPCQSKHTHHSFYSTGSVFWDGAKYCPNQGQGCGKGQKLRKARDEGWGTEVDGTGVCGSSGA
jgi:hypothetical protein